MKLTLNELKAAKEALYRLFDTPMSFNASREIQEAVKIINNELTEIDSKEKELLEKYGVDHPTHTSLRIVPIHNQASYKEELEAFLEKNEISDAIKIPLKTIEGVQISPRDLQAIFKFIED